MRRSIAAAALCLVAVACSREQWHRFPSPDDAVAAVPWFATMHRGLAIQPHQMPRNPVEGTVPVTGAEVPLLPIPQNVVVLNRMRNPIQRTSESFERGRDRFEIYCAVCHGLQGLGDGPVSQAVVAPSIVTPQARAYSAGFLYAIIRHGRGRMPAYGEKIRGDDRWHVVNYVQLIQRAAR